MLNFKQTRQTGSATVRVREAHDRIKQAQARAGAAGGAIASNQTGEALTATDTKREHLKTFAGTNRTCMGSSALRSHGHMA